MWTSAGPREGSRNGRDRRRRDAGRGRGPTARHGRTPSSGARPSIARVAASDRTGDQAGESDWSGGSRLRATRRCRRATAWRGVRPTRGTTRGRARDRAPAPGSAEQQRHGAAPPSPVAWEAWARSGPRLASRVRRTSTRWVSSARSVNARPRSGSWGSGSSRPRRRSQPTAVSSRPRSTVASSTTGVPASGAARARPGAPARGRGGRSRRWRRRSSARRPRSSREQRPPARRRSRLDVAVREGVRRRPGRGVQARSRRSPSARPRAQPRARGADAASSARPASRQSRRRRRPRRRPARLARGGGHEHHPVPLGGGPGQGAAGQQRLVVGVGVEGHQREPRSGSSPGSSASPPTRTVRARTAPRRPRVELVVVRPARAPRSVGDGTVRLCSDIRRRSAGSSTSRPSAVDHRRRRRRHSKPSTPSRDEVGQPAAGAGRRPAARRTRASRAARPKDSSIAGATYTSAPASSRSTVRRARAAR